MKSKPVLVSFSFVCACCASFFLGKASVKDKPGEQSASSPKGDLAESVEPYPLSRPVSRVKSDEEAVRIAREALIEVCSTDLEEAVVLTSGRYKLVSFRIWINPNDPKPPGPDKWHSPVWIDMETGAVVPPQIPGWKPMTDSRLKAFVMEWDRELPAEKAQNWNWDIKHVSGFARIVVRDPSPSPPLPDNVWVEDGDPFATEYWIDETREAVICAYDL